MTTYQRYSALRLFAMLFTVIATAFPSQAHENAPAIIDMTVDGPNVAITIDVNVESLVSGTADEAFSGETEEGAAEYLRLRDLSAADLATAYAPFADTYRNGLSLTVNDTPVSLTANAAEIPETGNVAVARISTLSFTATLPNTTGELKWTYPPEFGDSILRLFLPNSTEFPEPTLADFVPRDTTATVDLANIQPQSLGEVFVDYIVAGFDHIIPKGLDHILFVIGLFLLSAHLRPLLTQVTMFTLAHTITLALGALGYVNVPGNIVEPLIAASIIFIAVENIFTDKLTPWRPFLIFAFGLLHGLGFASVLGDFGLPPGQFIPALIAFNIGVEIGQLTVIAICFLAVGIWFRNKDWYHKVIVTPASLAIAIMATYWLLERTGFLA
jgi:hydrogenase/urease accessory protein HupE